MQSNHTVRKLKMRKSEMKDRYWNAERTIAGNQEVRRMRRRFFRADRQLTKRDLKLLARGNVYRDELEAIEAELAEAMMDDYNYYLGAEREWFEYEDDQDQRLWDEPFDYSELRARDQEADDPDHGCLDEDDNLISGWI